MGEANWACPVCQAAHLDTVDLPADILITHEREHVGEGGSTAHAQLCNDGFWRVFREGNGNRWTEREKYNPQPAPGWNKLDDFTGASSPDEEPERITDEAWRLVMGDRQSAYNHPASDFEATGRMWGAILTNWLRSEGLMLVSDGTKHDVDFSSTRIPDIDPRIVALMIGMVKVSRESHKHKHDNLVDLIGYALCADRVERDY